MGYWEAHKKYGRLPWSELFEPVIKLCETGSIINEYLAAYLVDKEPMIKNESSLARILINPNTGRVWIVSRILFTYISFIYFYRINFLLSILLKMFLSCVWIKTWCAPPIYSVKKKLWKITSKSHIYVQKGDRIKRPQLANTLKLIAQHGADIFYRGNITDSLVKEIREFKGIITRQDFEDYRWDFITGFFFESLNLLDFQGYSS